MSTFTKYTTETDEAWMIVWTGTAFAADDTDTKIVDISALSNSPLHLSVMSAQCSCDDGDAVVTLEWDETTDVQIWKWDFAVASVQQGSKDLDLWCKGGAGMIGVENPKGSGTTGDIFLTTSGVDAGSTVLNLVLSGYKIYV